MDVIIAGMDPGEFAWTVAVKVDGARNVLAAGPR